MSTSTQDFSGHIPASKSSDEAKLETVENLDHMPTQGTYYDNEEAAHLSNEHRQYLLDRHGTFDLNPMPDNSDADPYNWPTWKKVTNLTLVALHALMSTFTAAAIIPAYQIIAADFNTSTQGASYLTSLQIAILGVAPLIWKPFSNTYGRRPLFLLSLVCSLAGNIGCANSPSYATMAVCRAIVAFFISPAAAIGSAVVTETFFKKDRARYMGIWTLMVTLGVPLSPFIFGFVANDVGYRWIYYILAIINGIQFILYVFLGPETRYIRHHPLEHPVTHTSAVKYEYFHFSRIDPRPLQFKDFIYPLSLFMKPCVVIPAVSYAMTFLFGSVLITVELPQLFGEKFHFNPQQLGYQFLGLVVGSIIGEQLGGVLSDYWMNRATKKRSSRPAPEYRLWISYPGFVLTIIGVVVFLVQTNNAAALHWNISPVIGIAIAGAGNQIVTTVLITYAVDSHPEESASIGVFITFVRQVWGFIGPFWFPPMFTSIGLNGSAGVAAALLIGVSIAPMMLVQALGGNWRGVKNHHVHVENVVSSQAGSDVLEAKDGNGHVNGNGGHRSQDPVGEKMVVVPVANV